MPAAAATETYVLVGVAIAVIGLPLYQLRRDGFLPRPRRRDQRSPNIRPRRPDALKGA